MKKIISNIKKALIISVFLALPVTDSIAQTYTQTTPAYSWDDISSSGTVITSTAADDAAFTLTIPFTFTFFGTNYTTCYVNTNGLMSFGTSYTTYSNTCLPNTSTPNNLICAFWDDMYYNATSCSNFRYQTIGTAPNRRFVVSWISFSNSSSSCTNTVTTQIKLYETTNVIEVHLNSNSIGSTGTIGIEDNGGTTGYNPICNAATTNGSAWRWTPVACTAPTTQALNDVFSSVGSNTMTVSWTRGNGSNCAVFMYAGSSGTAAPVNGTTYTANTTFGSGTQIGSTGWYCIYNGTGTSVAVSGLTASTTYRVHVIEYNCTGTQTVYNTTSSTNNPANQATIAANAGDNCSNAQNLASLTSPYSATTVGYTDDISVCRTGYADRIFYISVPNCSTIDIWESTNSYDEYEYMGYGNTCPGSTTITCWDNDGLSHNTWTNSTGSTQTVWYVQDAYSGSGTFTLNWTLTGTSLAAPTTGTHTPSATQIVWNWNTVSGATGYKWNTTNNYATATDMGTALTYTETGLTCNTSYTRYVWAYNSCGNSVSTTLTSTTTACPSAGDNCSLAMDLASLTSPYSSTTVGYLSDVANCITGAPDRVFYINVPNGCSIDIWESTNGYDEYEYLGYGASCPGTQINCWDNDALAHNTWTNSTGSAQTVWYIQDGLSGGSGTFTLNWTLTCCAAPATVTATSSAASVPEGTAVTFNYSSHTGGLCGSGSWQYEWRDNLGNVLQSWSTTSSYTPTMNTVGTYTYYLYMRCSGCTSLVTQSNAVTVTVTCSPPANPANPTSSVNACGNKTLTFSGTPPAGVTWYWQTSCSNTDMTYSSSTYTASSSGTYYVRAYKISNGCWSTGCGSVTVSVELMPATPAINDTTVCSGDNELTAYGSGACVEYLWYNAASGGTLLNTGDIYDVNITSNTTFYVAAANAGSFSVTPLSTNSYVVNHTTASGDDRSGIAITPNYLYVVGDANTARMDLPLSLLTSTLLPIKDGLFSDLSTGTLWTLWNGTAEPVGTTLSGYTVNSLRQLDADLVYNGTTMALSTSFTVGDYGGIFAGKGFVIILDGDSGNFYHINLTTGAVTALGVVATPGRSTGENWATWGIAEYDGCDFSVLYANQTTDDITRLNLTTGATSVAADFTNIGDMTSLTVSPWENRWYFHHEYASQWTATSEEMAGYCDATITTTTGSCTSPRDPFTVTVTSPPLTPDGNAYPPAVVPGGSVILSASASGGTVTWFDDKCEGNIIGTGSSLTVTPPYSTTYFVATYNGCYSTCDSIFVQVVQPCNTLAFANGIPDTLSICSGDAVDLSATASCDYMMNNDFNDGTVGVGWSSNATPMFNNPCVAPNDGSIYLWIGPATDFPRELITQPYTVTEACQICFYMVYATQSDLTPCEGIDLPDEGVHVQYSTDAGATWTDIHYYGPDPDGNGDGGYDPQMTAWNHYCLNVPPGGVGSSTQFRFFQDVTSGYDYDHWGLDDVEISCPGSGLTVQWSHGSTELDPTADVYPTTSTTYTVIVDDGFNLGNADTSSVFIEVVGAPVTSDEQACVSGSSVTLTASGGTDYSWYNAAVGGTLLGTGPTYTIPSLTADQTVWVEFNTPSFGPVNYTFDTNLEGWTVQAPCTGTDNWAWNSDGGNGAMFAVDPAVGSSQVIISPAIDVSSYSGAITFAYRHKFTTESCCDHGYIAYRLNGGSWTQFTPSTGSYSGSDNQNYDPLFTGCASSAAMPLYYGSLAYSIHSGTIDVTGYNTLEIAFVFTSDGSVSSTGWFIDEITLTGGSAGACPNTRAEVHAYLSDLHADYTSNAVSCYGNNDGEMTAVAEDGSGVTIPGIFTYNWSNGSTASTVIDVSAGTYTLTITDAFGCTSTTSVSVSGPVMPTQIVNISGISGDCNIESPNQWVHIVNSTDADEVIASVFDATGGNNLFLTEAQATIFPTVQYNAGQPYLQRVVRVTPVSSGAATVRIYFTHAEFLALQAADPTITGISSLGVTKCSDVGVWTGCVALVPATFGVSPIGSGYYAEVNVSSFSKFYIHKYTAFPLPVELIEFKGDCNNNTVHLNWKTSSELNNDYFNVEKSHDLNSFEIVSKIDGSGTTNTVTGYNYTDFNPGGETVYYRLNQFDYDGNNKFSEIITVKCSDSDEFDFQVFANSTNQISISLNHNSSENLMVHLIDYTGKVIANKSVRVNGSTRLITIDNLNLSAGLYHIVLQSDNKTYSKRFVIAK